jgi:formylglycine-generating enzyme required for sulfatase activity
MKTTSPKSLWLLSTFCVAHWACAAAQADPVITNLTMVGGVLQFSVQSELGFTNQVQCCTNLSQTNWVVLTNVMVAQSPYLFVDVSMASGSRRFYRVTALTNITSPPPSGMVLIPAGSFTMGNTLEDDYTAIPISVDVSAFYMDTNLVSYSQWQGVYSWATSHGYRFDNDGMGKETNHPVQMVNWYDCVKWSNARSAQAGLSPVYYTDASLTQVYTNGETDAVYPNWAAKGYRLPTEAEWEKAARSGLSNLRFPWGNTIDWSQANYWSFWQNGAPFYNYDLAFTSGYDPAFITVGIVPYTSPVGYFPPNGYGLYDMAGNVCQWCWDWYTWTAYGQPTTTQIERFLPPKRSSADLGGICIRFAGRMLD